MVPTHGAYTNKTYGDVHVCRRVTHTHTHTEWLCGCLGLSDLYGFPQSGVRREWIFVSSIETSTMPCLEQELRTIIGIK